MNWPFRFLICREVRIVQAVLACPLSIHAMTSTVNRQNEMFPRKRFGADKITCKRKQRITHTIRPNLPEAAFADNVTRSGKSSWRTLLCKGSSEMMGRIQVLPFRVSFKRRRFLLCFISARTNQSFLFNCSLLSMLPSFIS